MLQNLKSGTFAWIADHVALAAAGAMFVGAATAQNKEPIKIGFGMSQTGPLSANGKSSLLAMKIWKKIPMPKAGCSAGRSNSSTTTIRASRTPCPASTPS